MVLLFQITMSQIPAVINADISTSKVKYDKAGSAAMTW